MQNAETKSGIKIRLIRYMASIEMINACKMFGNVSIGKKKKLENKSLI